MLDTDVAWAAGFFDGEGTIIIREAKKSNGKPVYSIHIGITQREREPLDKFSKIFEGGKIGLKPNSQNKVGKQFYYNWRLFGLNACRALEKMLPYLSTDKREQAELVVNKFAPLLGHQGMRRSITTIENMSKCYNRLLDIRQTSVQKARDFSRLREISNV